MIIFTQAPVPTFGKSLSKEKEQKLKKLKQQSDVVNATDEEQKIVLENVVESDAENCADMPADAQKENLTDVGSVETANVENLHEECAAKPQKRKIKFFSAGNMAVMGILTAISFVLYAFVKFPLSFMFPFWLDIQFSDLPALLGGFSLGPVAGCIIIVVKCCLKMPMTSTACVGELADIIVGIAFVLPASLIYKIHKNRKGALVGMAVGAGCAVAMSVLANWLVLIPFYARTMFGDGSYEVGMSKIVGMISTLYKGINVNNFYAYYLPLAVVPFNIIRCFLCAFITYFTYKPLSKALHWEITKKKKVADECPSDGNLQENTPDTQNDVERGIDGAAEKEESQNPTELQ